MPVQKNNNGNGITGVLRFRWGVLFAIAGQTIAIVVWLVQMRADINFNKTSFDAYIVYQRNEEILRFATIEAQQKQQDAWITRIDNDGTRKLQLIEDRQQGVIRNQTDMINKMNVILDELHKRK